MSASRVWPASGGSATGVPSPATTEHFIARTAPFRGWVVDAPTDPFPLEPDRYHLYVARACPWAHYHLTHPMINPSGLVAVAPAASFQEPHGRQDLSASAP